MNLSRPYDRQVIRGIARYVRSGVPWQIYVEEDPADKIPSFSRWSDKGVIVDLDDMRLVRAVQGLNVPVVGIGHLPSATEQRSAMSTVRSDDEAIAHWAADHLLELGLANFAYYGMPRRGMDVWAQARYETFQRRLRERGFACHRFSGKHYAARNWSRMLGELVRWLRSLPRPIGIMACNDSCARRLLEACRQLRLRVPEDVAVLGVDNDELTCELAMPPLSSIAQGAEQIGYRAAELLDELMARTRRGPTHLVVAPLCLVRRQSTELVTIDDRLIARALDFIQARAMDPVGVADVVRHVDVSRSTLETRFRARLGRSVHEALQRVRLQTARRLLLTTQLPLDDVARRSGFRTVHYLCHVFRRELGETPGQVRARHGAEESDWLVHAKSQ
jgi:LacI family transcriptional regulator